jgi:hypothetical protein
VLADEEVGTCSGSVAAPADKAGRPWRAELGAPLSVTWTTDDGLHETAGALADVVSGPPPLWVIQVVSVAPARQRRNAFRLRARLPVSLQPADAGMIDAYTTDISEGGLGIVLPPGVPVESGTRMAVALRLDDGRLRARATVVRVTPAGGGQRIGLRFDGLEEPDAARIRR